MRLIRPVFAFSSLLLLCLAAGSLEATTYISVGASTGSTTNCGALAAGQTCTLTARITSTDSPGTTFQAASWSFSPTVSGANPGSNSYSTTTGQNSITYTAPSTPISQRITVTATVTASDGTTAQGLIVLIPPTFTITVSPSTVTLFSGQTQLFTALVTGFSQTGVTWSINTQVGSIDSSTGLYTAPVAVSTTQTVRVTATSTFDNTTTGTATITLSPPLVTTVTIAPTSVTLSAGGAQQFTATVTNATNTAVTWAISPQVGSIDSTGLYAAPATVTTSQRVTVSATSQADASKQATATVTLSPTAAVSVTISPTTATLTTNQMQQFTATVSNASNTSVTWAISPQTGSIDQNGLYTSPATIPATQKVVVTAASEQDVTKSATATITLNPVVDIGTGAPTNYLASQFMQAYNRNGFQTMVSLPPTGKVTVYGSTGYIQLFQDAAKTSGVTYALITASTTASGGQVTVVQIWGPMYAYFTSLGVGTVGFPLADTQNCAYIDVTNSCTYQFFDKSYVLFVYSSALSTGTNFNISGTFYTEWNKLGGTGGAGRPISAQATVTASSATTATAQFYASGAIYSITSGTFKGQIFGVTEPLYDLYVANGAAGGKLGLPVGEVITLASGDRQQRFEGGTLVYSVSSGGSTQYPVSSVGVAGVSAVPGATTTLSLGQTVTLTATPFDTASNAVPDRAVSWSSSNSKVISIQASGATAVLTAAGAGAATVYASSGGVSSAKLYFVVTAPCCQVGDGAPVTVQQAFVSALTRIQLTAPLPIADRASRVGNGYVQTFQATSGGTSVVYMIAKGDAVGSAYVVSGAVLTRYLALGGPAGALGYPSSDQTAGGRQLFENSASLAGNPVCLVTTPVLAKWAALSYETGAAGSPVADAATFTTFAASSGAQQTFAKGVVYAATSGLHSGQAFLVSGLILTGYNAAGGVGGDLGMPVTDEFVSGTVHQQNFEGGYLTYSAGDAAAQVNLSPRTPAVVVAPATIFAGGTARLAVSGFANNSTLRVSVSGKSDFLVTAASGAYAWDMFVPLAAASGTVTIHAADTKGTATADGTLTIKGFDKNHLQLAKVQGDNQTGVPGGLLPLPLQVALVDSSGSPVAGVPVTFQASSGAQLTAATVLTDSSGHASTYLRLPATAGTAGVNASAPSVNSTPVTFYAAAAAASLSGFPSFSTSGTLLGNGNATIAQKGALLTTAAAILRYRQNRGELASPNGMADPGTMNQFLTSYCATDSNGKQVCDGFLSNPDSGEQIVNLWRAAEFTGAVDIEVESASTTAVTDWLAQGEPLLLSLELSLNGQPAGGNVVAAIGVAADGSIVIQDPNPRFARTNLNDYLNGFSVAGGKWSATLAGVVRFAVRSPSATRFMVGELSQPVALLQNTALAVVSASGACGQPLPLMDLVDSSGAPPAGGALLSRIAVCDGVADSYQVSVGATQAYRAFVTDLAAGGSFVDVSGQAPVTYLATRPQLNLVLSPQTAAIAASGVVNAANFGSGIAPGGLMAIFGTGLAGPSSATTVDVDGISATVLGASPFQVNAQVPAALAAGQHTLQVTSPFGTAQQAVMVSALAPAIFVNGTATTGVVANQDYTLNSPTNPLPRGQTLVVYATGLGSVTLRGSLSVVNSTVTAVVNGSELPVAFAGLAPGYVGVYQVNVAIPANTAPGSGISLSVKQGGVVSNVVSVALQ